MHDFWDTFFCEREPAPGNALCARQRMCCGLTKIASRLHPQLARRLAIGLGGLTW